MFFLLSLYSLLSLLFLCPLSQLWNSYLYSVSKKTPLKEMCDFLTLKMLPLALALIKTKNRHLFDPLVKNWPFSMENSLQASKTLNSHVKWAFSDQWVKKRYNFLFWSTQEPMVTFLGLKNLLMLHLWAPCKLRNY